MFKKAVEKYLYTLRFVPDHLKTQGMCEIAVEKDPYTLKFVPDWLVTQQQIKIRHDDHYYGNDNEIIEWYEGHQKRKIPKAQIKDELMSIAWYPSGSWDWCVSEDEKKEKCFWPSDMLRLKCINKRRCWNLVKQRLQVKTFTSKDE